VNAIAAFITDQKWALKMF